MKRLGPRFSGPALLALTLAVTALDVAWLAFAARRSDSSAAFARATGAVGLGAATSPAWSFFGFDPRTQSACESETFPIAGLPCPDPTHGGGVALFPPRPLR